MQLWYPDAIIPEFRMKTRGKYKDNYPVGAVVHFTAGRSKDGLKNAIRTTLHGKENGYCYLSISSDGKVVQSFALDEWGYHAGQSTWPGLGEGVSNKLVGIEVCCAGRLVKDGEEFESWFGEKYSSKEVRYSAKIDNIKAGFYHKYTAEQEKSLEKLLLWLKNNNPKVFNLDYILGHDEVAAPRGRKNDPGGSLSLTMPNFRRYLKSEYARKHGDT